MKGDWGKHFGIQGTSYGNFETVVHIHVSPAHEYPRKQTKHPQYLDYEDGIVHYWYATNAKLNV